MLFMCVVKAGNYVRLPLLTWSEFSFVPSLTGMNVFVAFFVLNILLADSTPRAMKVIPLIGRLLYLLAFHSMTSFHWLR